jgi:hypothetical protein
MKISGYKNRKISTFDSDSKLAYNLDMSVTNTTGEAVFGISGFIGSSNSPSNSKKVQFTLKSGRVFDPEDRCVYSYQQDENINLKGTFLPSSYDYFIDNNLICTKGSKTDFKIRNFFFDSDGCEINIRNLDLYGPTGSLDLEETMSFEVFGTSGTSGSSGYGSTSSSGSSGTGDTVTFSNALTFNSGINLVGSVLSGEVTIGKGNFAFDNSSSNITSLNDVGGNGTKKDLKLIAQTELSKHEYILGIDFHTTFGKIRRECSLRGVKPENPSGISLSMIDDDEGFFGNGAPLNSGGIRQDFGFIDAGQGEKVSGVYSVGYSAEKMSLPESSAGLPYKVYLEHVEGDHSKQYSFITGVKLSGSGLGYTSTSSSIKDIVFRTGELDALGVDSSAGSAGIAGASFGTIINDEAVGLISVTTDNSSKMVEAHLASISTNLYTGEDGSSGSDVSHLVKTNDGTLITRHTGVVDISTVIPQPNSVSATTKILASGIPEIFNYTKPASDWRLFTGEFGADEFVEQTATGADTAPLKYWKYKDGDTDFLDISVMAKNYVDIDPMVYRLVVSGADGFLASANITGTVMDSGPFNAKGNLDGIPKYTPIHPLTASS